MQNPFLVSQEEGEELNALQEQYPYCSSISMLLSKAYHTQESISFEQQLKNTAISIPDRAVLYDLINLEGEVELIELAKEEIPEVIEAITEEPIEEKVVEKEIDEENKTDLVIGFCTQTGCFVNMDLNDKLIRAIGNADAVQVNIQIADGKAVSVPFSAKGFLAAHSIL